MTTIRRTPEQIVARIEELVSAVSLFDFRPSDLVGALPYEQAKPYLNEGVGPKKWAAARTDDPLQAAREYLGFAWEKANDCRGLSAARSLQHLEAWLWLAGLDVDFSKYAAYGKGWLVAITTALLGPDSWQKFDNGSWVDDEWGPNKIESHRTEIQEMEVLGLKWADQLRS